MFKSLFDQFLNYDTNKIKCNEPGCNAFYVGISRENKFTSYDNSIKSAKQIIGIHFNKLLIYTHFDENTLTEKKEIKTYVFKTIFN